LFERCGRLEAYFLSKLVMRKAGFGFDYEGSLVAKVVASRFGAPAEHVAHAMALTDVFHVAELLAREGVAGLRSIQLQPLVPVRPALAGGTTDQLKRFPVWVERKYDGIRFMLHKSTDANGSLLCAAYTRNRRDWLELVAGLDASIKQIPARTAIVDGELYGTVLDYEGARPATVYEVYHALHGERRQAVNLKFAAFDLVYCNGQDLTRLPLSERRHRLQVLLGSVAGLPLPIPLSVAEGQLANDKDDVNRLYGHFRSQGYEGIITKDLAGGYALADRDPDWMKRKPEETLDLVLLGGVFAVTEKPNVGVFGSYVIGALTPEGAFADVGDVAGVDKLRDAEIQGEIMRESLITGRRIERQSASGVRPGVDLRPHIVVTVRFEGIIRDTVSGDLKMRDPKLVAIRGDKNPTEANSTRDIEQLYLRQRVG
jgi:DNA ligase-1